uniref:Uncharacterized protein n=1 Tax=mine drainage metagenome TaxID=410659 RepID=E6Q5T6_9ZZZZ
MSTPLNTDESVDIFVGSIPGRLGRNWWGLEVAGSTRFRWARSGAEIFVAALDPVIHTLKLLLEPGPGVGLKAFALEVMDGEKSVATVEVKGKQAISVPLPPAGPTVYRIALRAQGGGAATAGDARVMDFRVFSISAELGPRDVLPPTMKLGMGWYPLETQNDTLFRWVNNNAEIALSNPDGREILDFEIEPGPGAAGKPLHLQVSRKENGKQTLLAEFSVTGRERIEVPLLRSDRLDLILHTDAGGGKVAGETRTLNFRLFQYPGA